VPSSGRFDSKKRTNQPIQQQQEADQELEEASLEAKEPEYARQQNQVGNQAVSAMIASKAAQKSSDDSAAGIDVAHALSQEDAEKESGQFGGDDEPADPGPLTIAPSAFAKNPGLKKFKDRQALRQYMPDDRLPVPDPDYLAAVQHAFRSDPLPITNALDNMLQPSAAVVASSLASWTEGVTYWAGNNLGERCVAHFIQHPPPCIQDAEGRVLIGRTRAASAALALLTSSPTLRQPADALTCSFLTYCLEITGRQRTVEEFRITTQSDDSNRLPVAAKLLEAHLAGNTYQRPAQALSEEAYASLEYFLRRVIDAWKPESFLPNFGSTQQPSTDPDDPLNLDAVMTQMLGPAKDQDDFLVETALTAAEHLATECARLRIQVAGTAIIISRLSELWTAGSPDTLLMSCANQVDAAVREALKLLVEIATAAKQKKVDTTGLENGLKHAATRVVVITDTAISCFIKAITTVLPGNPTLVIPPDVPDDPLSDAWGDSRPGQACDWLTTLPPTLETKAALLLTRADMGLSAPSLREEALQVRAEALAEGAHLYAHIAGLIAANGYLQADQPAAALELAGEMRSGAWQRRNGLALAAAAMYQLEALVALDQHEKVPQFHLEAGQQAWMLGAEAALSLLGRWKPAVDEV
jgi:hypothetical protein